MGLLKTVAFHSYKGGTGKTTLISNIAALYAKNGFNVALLDFDLYAPSLSSYFKKKPSVFINDLLSGQAKISDVVYDLTSELGLNGKFLVGFSSSRKEDVNEIDMKHDSKWQIEAVKRFIKAKQELNAQFKIDYLFLDTSPGIRYWSINTLATSDYIFLLLKDSDMDIEGTRKMIIDIYDSLSRYGAKYYAILNKVPGETVKEESMQIKDEKAWISELERVVGADVVGSIPCFCDIQFSRHEFLFSIRQPSHPFSTRLEKIAETIKKLSETTKKNDSQQ
jgi:MinD-like ATPase involved in chromosome partitioning or flagellar assembly